MLNSKDPESSTPDDHTPRDIAGHGTAVAMVAAGASVETDLGEFSGVAPKARIGVYKVFGTPGVNFHTADHAVIAAIDDAILDGMDILNLSLGHLAFWKWDAAGRDCGQGVSTTACDPLAAAAQNAVVDFGKVVVVAAGNGGLRGSHELPSLNTINSPGNAPAVITVGGIGNAYSDFRESVSGRQPVVHCLERLGANPGRAPHSLRQARVGRWRSNRLRTLCQERLDRRHSDRRSGRVLFPGESGNMRTRPVPSVSW